jgi:hypothetical protein
MSDPKTSPKQKKKKKDFTFATPMHQQNPKQQRKFGN